MKKFKCTLEPIYVMAEHEEDAVDKTLDWLNDYGFESVLEVIEVEDEDNN